MALFERFLFLTSRNVHVVDDDSEVRSSIGFMLGTAGFTATPFVDGEDFLAQAERLEPGCVLLDVRMPNIDGFKVMETLLARGIDWPVVVMTGHGEVPIAVRSMKLGAVDFLEKPFGEELLLSSLERAFALLREKGDRVNAKRRAKERVGRLSPREYQVLGGLVSGRSNKLIARDLDLSLRTVEMHRASMMGRLEVSSLAEALTLAAQAEVPGPEQPPSE